MTREQLTTIIRPKDVERYKSPSTFSSANDLGIAVCIAGNVTAVYHPNRIEIEYNECSHRREYLLSLKFRWQTLPYDTIIDRLLKAPFTLIHEVPRVEYKTS